MERLIFASVPSFGESGICCVQEEKGKRSPCLVLCLPEVISGNGNQGPQDIGPWSQEPGLA